MEKERRRKEEYEDGMRYLYHKADAAPNAYRDVEAAKLKEVKRRRCGEAYNHDLDCLNQ